MLYNIIKKLLKLNFLIIWYFFSISCMEENNLNENKLLAAKDIIKKIVRKNIIKYSKTQSTLFISKLFNEEINIDKTTFAFDISSPVNLVDARWEDLPEELLFYIFTENINHVFWSNRIGKAAKQALLFIKSIVFLNKRFYAFKDVLINYLKTILVIRFIEQEVIDACKQNNTKLANILLGPNLFAELPNNVISSNYIYYSFLENMLNNYSPNVDAKDAKGYTALHYSVLNNNKDVFNLLLKNNANIDKKDEGGCTPLMHSARLGNKKILKILLHNCADYHAKDNNGFSALAYATNANNNQIATILKRYEEAEEVSNDQTKENIVVNLKFLDQNQCKSRFGFDITKKGYVFLKIRIKNHTPDIYIIRPGYLNFEITNPRDIGKLFHWRTTAFVSSVSVAGLIYFWPAAPVSWVAGSGMAIHNRFITGYFTPNSLLQDETVIVKPYLCSTKFVFVKATELAKGIEIKIFNKNKKKILKFSHGWAGKK